MRADKTKILVEMVHFEERDKVHVSRCRVQGGKVASRVGVGGNLWAAKGNRKRGNKSFIGRGILGSECG